MFVAGSCSCLTTILVHRSRTTDIVDAYSGGWELVVTVTSIQFGFVDWFSAWPELSVCAHQECDERDLREVCGDNVFRSHRSAGSQ